MRISIWIRDCVGISLKKESNITEFSIVVIRMTFNLSTVKLKQLILPHTPWSMATSLRNKIIFTAREPPFSQLTRGRRVLKYESQLDGMHVDNLIQSATRRVRIINRLTWSFQNALGVEECHGNRRNSRILVLFFRTLHRSFLARVSFHSKGILRFLC
jgi:hypothetical protein